MESVHARYPFLAASRAAVEAAEIDLAELVMADHSPIVDRAVSRVEGAVTEGRAPDPISDNWVELLSYPVARVLVSIVDEPVLTARYALAEARRASSLLASELGDDVQLRSTSTKRLTLEQLLDEFDLADQVLEDGDGYEIAVTAYLAHTVELRGADWRLVNRHLAGGMVPISRRELETLLQETIRERVADGLPLSVPDEIAMALADTVATIEDSLSDVAVPEDIDRVVPACFPPCMSALLERLQAGEDLTVIERFSIVSFLTSIGLDEEGLVELIGAPSASDERLLRYQVNHVHGAARSTAYPPPSCDAMQSYGVCVDGADRCAEIGHPIATYARRLAETGDDILDSHEEPFEA